jgi:outer membrane protein assembly factor BamB
MRWTRRAGIGVVLVATALLVPVVALAALRTEATRSTGTAATTAAVPASDWTTYHHDERRTSDGVLRGTFATLSPKFVWNLPTATASERNDHLYGSPLVAGSVAYVATLEDRVYAISLKTGHTLWSRTLGPTYTPPGSVCGNILPTVGIVSTPVIDLSRNKLFVVGDTGTRAGGQVPVHRIFGLSLTNGKVMLDRVVDPPGQNPVYLLQRVSLGLDAGRVIFGFGGNGGDCGPYHGWVESVPEAGGGAIDRFEVAKDPTQGRGAVWMGGGAPVIAPNGHVFVADGNGDAITSTSAYDNSDAVLELTPTMHLIDFFAPPTWYSDNKSDFDLGSGQPELLPNGLILQVGKTHLGYVLNASHLGHITAHPAEFTICDRPGDQPDRADGGDALVGSMVVVPCLFGLDAVRVLKGRPYGRPVWNQPDTNGPPAYAGGLVWSIKFGAGGSKLYALNPNTGGVEHEASIGPIQNHFPTPAIGDNLVVVTTTTQVDVFAPN